MKKILNYLICILIFFSISKGVQAADYNSVVHIYDLTEMKIESIDINITGFEITTGEQERLEIVTDDMNLHHELNEKIEPLLNSNDNVIILHLKTNNEENPYPDIQAMNVRLFMDLMMGGRTPKLGKDYRVYYLENDELTTVELDFYDEMQVEFKTDKLGVYVLCYNPCVYSVTFYDDSIEKNENGEIINDEYHRIDDLRKYGAFEYPEIPEKDGCVFTGWKQDKQTGAYYSYRYIEPTLNMFSNEWKVYAFDVWEIYASWCPEEEYTPLEVTIKSDKKITKGKEDGAEIILTLSEGKFEEGLDGNIEEDWKIVGNDELAIASVERIDDMTVKLTLSGNSSSKYTDGEIQVEFNSSLYVSHEYFEGQVIREVADIQLDENGVKRGMFISDNGVKLEKQKRSNGGSSGTTSYTVNFNTNGGEDVASQRVKRNDTVTEPESPVRDGHVFKGWYTDAELTDEYDFATKVTKSFTLYAAWREDNSNKIILTVGEKDIIVFGKNVINDVAPVIKNDRVMLPIRFVAENLGAEVVWDKYAPDEVNIIQGETEIVIYVGRDYALVDGAKAKLDSPTFVEHDRTYVPIRFVAESLGCNVTWHDEAKEVVITK